MKLKWLWVIVPVFIVLAIAIIFISYRSKVAYSTSVMGGADELEKFLSGSESEVIIRLLQ